MSPVLPLGRKRAIKLVRAGRLPIQLRSPPTHVAIVEQDGVFRIRALVVDRAKADRASREALANGESWMPEHHYGLGEPTGEIHVEAATRAALVAEMEAMEWPSDW